MASSVAPGGNVVSLHFQAFDGGFGFSCQWRILFSKKPVIHRSLLTLTSGASSFGSGIFRVAHVLLRQPASPFAANTDLQEGIAARKRQSRASHILDSLRAFTSRSLSSLPVFYWAASLPVRLCINWIVYSRSRISHQVGLCLCFPNAGCPRSSFRCLAFSTEANMFIQCKLDL